MTPAEEAFETMKEIVRRAIITLMTLRDPDRKYQYRGSDWLFPVVNQAQEAYGYVQYGFDPTPHDISMMEIVAEWLAWLRREEGEWAIRRIISWTLGVPTWRIGAREKCSERTVRNRIDRSISAIIAQFADVNFEIETVEDPTIPNPYAMVTEKSPGPHGNPVILKKVYIYDKGFYRGGRRIRDGGEKAEKFMARA